MGNKSVALIFTGALWLCSADAETNVARNGSTKDPMLLHQSDSTSIRAHFQAGLNAVAETNLFWNLAELALGNTEFDADAQWLESYLEPGLSFERKFGAGRSLFGKASFVASYTAGTDAFDTGDTGETTLEEGFLGFGVPLSENWALQTSVGSQVLKIGTGMLIANGGGDGFERGTLKFGPREAWELAGVAKLTNKNFTTTTFYIEPNELDSNDTNNRLAGADIRWDGENGGYAGFTYLHVLESDAPYPKAPLGGVGLPTIIPGGRDGLNTVNFYGRTDRLDGWFSNVALLLDYAYQWNDENDVRAWAGRLKAEYRFVEVAWQPVLSYSYQRFSGDDPNTRELERFDPLYYDGSPSAWATGSKSAMVFINSNVQSHNLSFRITPTKSDVITLRYSHVRADELRSPIQFGQAARLEFADGLSTVVTGVTDAHLSDDLFIEYMHIFNPNIYLTSGFSISIPGEGNARIAGGDAPNWTGGFANVVINY